MLLAAGQLDAPPPGPEGALFLGVHRGVPVFALELAGEGEEPPLAGLGEFVELRPLAVRLPRPEAALLAHARALAYWHRRHLFCGACGAPTLSRDAGHRRDCTACDAQHFPRVDPAVIVLLTRGERCLLVRQAAWAERQYAVVAGFVEPGESLEDAVAREVMEETGLRVRDARYHSSQPWPFPGSIMLGFTATAEEGELQLDGEELEDARWFSRDELRDAVRRGDVRMPSPLSIAFALVDGWLRG